MPKTSKIRWKKGDMNNKKKAAIVREYRKMMKVMKKDGTVNSCHERNSDILRSVRPKSDDKKMPIFKRAMLEFREKQSEKKRQKEAREAARKQKEEAIKRHKERRKEVCKRLSKKTKWGQPVMKNRVELLLEELQERMNQS